MHKTGIDVAGAGWVRESNTQPVPGCLAGCTSASVMRHSLHKSRAIKRMPGGQEARFWPVFWPVPPAVPIHVFGSKKNR